MTPPEIHVVVPGSLDQWSGGYIYDARMVDGLRCLGWRVMVHSLDGNFPDVDTCARTSFTKTLTELPNNSCVIVDGLAMGALPESVRAHSSRLRILALVHHPLADETGLEPRQRERFAALEREALAACTGVLVTSDFTASRMKVLGVPTARMRAVLPGTEPARPAAGPEPDDPPRLLCVASVIPRKGQDVLIRALALLPEAKWRCVCAGSLTRAPVYAAAVQAQACGAGLGKRVRFVGECEPDVLEDLYHSSSLFVFPSHYEGYGIALTEALARGLPVISTTGGAIPCTVPADAGVLVSPGDHGALADALSNFLSDPPGNSRNDASSGSELRTKFAAAARRYATTLPDWKQAAVAFAAAALELAKD